MYHKKRFVVLCAQCGKWQGSLEFSQWPNIHKEFNHTFPLQVAYQLLCCRRGNANSRWQLRIWKPGRQFSEMELHQSDQNKEKRKYKPVLVGLEASKARGLAKRQRTVFCIGLVSSLPSCLVILLILFHLSETMNKEKTAAYCQSHLHTFWCYYPTAIITSFQETSKLFRLGMLLYYLYFYGKR